MQSVVNQIFAALGAQRQIVVVQPTKSTIAGATGLRADVNLPLFDLQGTVVAGIIHVGLLILGAVPTADGGETAIFKIL